MKDNIKDFRFQHIIEKMVKIHPDQRYASFLDITADISAGVISEINFTNEQKNYYRNFAIALSSHIRSYTSKFNPIDDVALTLTKLAELIRNSALEKHIQDNSLLISCFLNGGYSYNPSIDIEVQTVIDFYSLVISLPSSKRKILFDNIYTRLSTIEVENDDEDLPF